MSSRRTIEPRYFIWACTAGLILAWAIRYFNDPSFWLDEAFIAVSVREHSIAALFGPLKYGQHFPRIYLALIAALRNAFGYETQVLRLLPSLCFLAATLLWARLLVKRAGTSILPCLIAGSLLLGSSYWMDQAVQLKQYSLDVMLSIIPFIISDDFFNRTLGDGKDKKLLPLLAVGGFISYSYPIALIARAVGWYLYRWRRRGRALNLHGVIAFVLPVLLGLLSIWVTDYRYNLLTHISYQAYWKNCILASRLSEGAISAMGLTTDFIWGWHHGRLMPLVVVAVIPLQIAGVYWAVKRWVSGELDESEKRWGSRTLGSLVLLISAILSSAIISYPICAGRLTLFAQVHTQILIIEGALFFSSRPSLKRGGVFLSFAAAIILLYSVDRYRDFILSEPPDNIRPMLSMIKPEIANTVWVHPCSIAQVRSLPEPLPVEEVVTNTRKSFPEPGTSVWVLWTHMSEGDCTHRMNELRERAVSWEVVHEGFSRGLALARF